MLSGVLRFLFSGSENVCCCQFIHICQICDGRLCLKLDLPVIVIPAPPSLHLFLNVCVTLHLRHRSCIPPSFYHVPFFFYCNLNKKII